ncbi:MAG: ABC transporter ATP-binding protein [Acidobacteriota bacterium]
MKQQETAIRLEHVSKAFGDHEVLNDVSFGIRRGSAFCILGRSGTGKSVILKHMIGLVKPDSGSVFINDEEITELESRQLSRVRRDIGFLFQGAALFDSISVRENVAFPLRRHTDWPEKKIRDTVFEKLSQVGLEKEYDKMPASLSGGMRKRAGLARALALDPSIVLVDEPSSGLDPLTSEEIDRLLLSLKSKHRVTLVIVTHNILSARAVGDEIGVIHQGQMIARGTAAELQESDDQMVRQFMEFGGLGN